MRSIPVFCGKDCGGNSCPLLATVEDGVVTHVANNPAAGPFLTGCRRGYALPRELHSPRRILRPLIRRGERGSLDFREASWDEALDLLAARLGEIRAKHGPGSVLSLDSDGSTTAMHNTKKVLPRFLNLSGGATYTRGNYSNEAARFVLPYLLGSGAKRAGFDAATMKYAKLVVLWGANVFEARLGTEVEPRLLEAKEAGTEFVVVDPRRSATVKRLGARWLPCRPGTDAALMLAVLHELISGGLVDRPFVETRAAGFDRLEAYVLGRADGKPKTPAWASSVCGLPEAEIVSFARLYGTAKPALLFPGYSIQRVFAGEEPYRLAVALQVATGNFGVMGGSTGAFNNRLPAPRVGTLPVPPSPLRAFVPILRWPDAILEGRKGGYPSDVRAVYAAGCDFVNQGGDVRKSVQAFRTLEFSVCHELFMTPTARLSDLVLPVAHTLEREDVGIPWAGNFLTYKTAAVPPRGHARTDYDILAELADRMGFGGAYTAGRDDAAWIRKFIDESEVDDRELFMRTGVWFGAERERTGLADFAADPAGRPLDTPSGRVEISSEAYARDTGFSPFPVWQERIEDPRWPLLLVTPKSARRTHSQGGDLQAPGNRRDDDALEMNPADATERGIRDGRRAKIRNGNGVTIAPVRWSEDLMPGVVCLRQGVWARFDADGTDLEGSANMLTSTEGTRPAVGNVMHGVAVQVEAAP